MSEENDAVQEVDEAVQVDDPGLDRTAEEEEKHTAALAAKIDVLVEKGDTKEPATDEQKPRSEDGKAVEGNGSDDLAPEALSRAVSAGLDKDTAEALHGAGLLERHLAKHDQRLIESAGRPAEQAGEERTPAPRRPEPPMDTGTQDRGEVARPEGMPEPLSADDFGEEVAARDKWMQDTVLAQQQQIQQLMGHVGAVQGQKQDAFEQWLDESINGLDSRELFGEGQLGEVPPTERENRLKVADAYVKLCAGSGVDPTSLDPEMLQRAYHAGFYDKIAQKTQQRMQSQMRDAAGRFVSPTASSDAPARELTEEEKTADLYERADALIRKS